MAEGETILLADMHSASVLAVDDLDHGFFRSRIDRTTEVERAYLRAMATLGGPGPYRTADISLKLDKKPASLGPVRDGLIKRGLRYSPRHGELAFTVPMFDSFVRRNLS
jgi:hypothetical protein